MSRYMGVYTTVASRLYRQQSRILKPKISQPKDCHSKAIELEGSMMVK
jgi:hypothetical protein